MDTSLQAVARPAARGARLPSVLALWHLLSLDAPTVASLWVWFTACATHTPVPAALPLAMFLCVWLLYAADRLLDGAPSAHQAEPLEARHLFHRAHRLGFLRAIVGVSLALIPLIFALPAELLRRYLLLAALLALWFGVIHWLGRGSPLPKELLTGVFFAAAIFVPAFSLATLPAAVCLALLCTLNCLYIFAWEHPHGEGAAHTSTRLGVRALEALGWIAILAPLLSPGPRAVLLAEALAAALLLALHRKRRALDRTTLRAAADLALLTPMLLALFLR